MGHTKTLFLPHVTSQNYYKSKKKKKKPKCSLEPYSTIVKLEQDPTKAYDWRHRVLIELGLPPTFMHQCWKFYSIVSN